MIKYGYEVIQCLKLDKDFVNKINYNKYANGGTVAIQVLNTKSIDKDALILLDNMSKKFNINIKISIIGPYYYENINNEILKEKNFRNTIYETKEVYKIITQFEEIEKMIDPNWSKFDIIVFLADTLVRNIMYDPEYYLMWKNNRAIPMHEGLQDKADYHDRTLRGMLSRKTVCVGFATIFKELANRNGIDCKMVNGKFYTEQGEFLGGHAWNLVRIDGKIYPLDLSRKSSKYRDGDFSNTDDISCDIDIFKKTHKPDNPRDNDNLSRIDVNIVEHAKKKTIIRRRFAQPTFSYFNEGISITQLGSYRGLYKYLYTTMRSDGSYEMPEIFFSESNIFKEYNDDVFEKGNDYDSFKKSFFKVLFSKENINDSKEKGTKYIGACELPNNGGYAKEPSEIIKSESAIKRFKLSNIKSQRRDDGSIVTLVQFKNTDNNYNYQYFVYVLSPVEYVIEYKIYSDTDYFSMNSYDFANSIFNDKNLNDAVTKGGMIR